jgi:hypothetical protein
MICHPVQPGLPRQLRSKMNKPQMLGAHPFRGFIAKWVG